MVTKLTVDMGLTNNGLRDWLIQRLTAIVLTFYFLVSLGFFLFHPHLNFVSLQKFYASTWMQVFSLIAFLCVFLHAWVGIWTVITDYIHSVALKFFLEFLVIVVLLMYFFWSINILWRLV